MSLGGCLVREGDPEPAAGTSGESEGPSGFNIVGRVKTRELKLMRRWHQGDGLVHLQNRLLASPRERRLEFCFTRR